jgi:hypothetical protein
VPPYEPNDGHLDRGAIRSVAGAADRGFALGFLIVVASLAVQALNLALPPGTLPRTPVPASSYWHSVGGSVGASRASATTSASCARPTTVRASIRCSTR